MLRRGTPPGHYTTSSGWLLTSKVAHNFATSQIYAESPTPRTTNRVRLSNRATEVSWANNNRNVPTPLTLVDAYGTKRRLSAPLQILAGDQDGYRTWRITPEENFQLLKHE